jgi:PHD/YefM family antitoxin component YafN of YafNO toxin-antitoxin module
MNEIDAILARVQAELDRIDAQLQAALDHLAGRQQDVPLHQRGFGVMDEDDTAGWQETEHLLASPKNAERLMASIRQARAGTPTPPATPALSRVRTPLPFRAALPPGGAARRPRPRSGPPRPA